MGPRSPLDEAQQQTFDDAFRSEFGALHRYLRRRLGSTRADDVAAETFATAYASWHRFDSTRPVAPWLYGIAANLVRHHYRDEERMLRAYAKTGADPVVYEDEDRVIQRLDASTLNRDLAAALAILRPQDRELLLLHAWAGLNDQEIATALELPVGTVKSRLYRLRERMRNQIAPTGQEGTETVSTRSEEIA